MVLSPLNDWMDLSTTRLELSHRGAPPMVLPTLVVLSILGAVLAGFNMAKHRARSFLHILAFAGSLSCCLYVIMDMEHPRAGLIRIDAADHAMQAVVHIHDNTGQAAPQRKHRNDPCHPHH